MHVFYAVVLALVTACVTALAMMDPGPIGMYSPGVILGGLLATYLWTRHGVRSGLGGFVGICFGAFILSMFGAMPLSLVTPSLGRTGFWAPGPMVFVVAGLVGGSIVSGAFLLLLPGLAKGRRLAAEIMIGSAAGAMLGFAGASAQHRYGSVGEYGLLFLIWQSGMALLLAGLAERRPRSSALANEPPPVLLGPREFS